MRSRKKGTIGTTLKFQFFLTKMPPNKHQKLTGVAKIIAEKKEKGKKEAIRRSKLKSQLEKLYKTEGITATPPTGQKNDTILSEDKNNSKQNISKFGGKRSRKPNTFKTQLIKSSTAEQEKQRRIEERQKKAEEIAKSKKERLNSRISLSKRTKKGQPVMANIINHLLEKIEKSCGKK